SPEPPETSRGPVKPSATAGPATEIGSSRAVRRILARGRSGAPLLVRDEGGDDASTGEAPALGRPDEGVAVLADDVRRGRGRGPATVADVAAIKRQVCHAFGMILVD